jgi:hypothetical protein
MRQANALPRRRPPNCASIAHTGVLARQWHGPPAKSNMHLQDSKTPQHDTPRPTKRQAAHQQQPGDTRKHADAAGGMQCNAMHSAEAKLALCRISTLTHTHKAAARLKRPTHTRATRTHTHAHTPQESTEVHDILLLKNQNLKTPPKARISCWLFSALL